MHGFVTIHSSYVHVYDSVKILLRDYLSDIALMHHRRRTLPRVPVVIVVVVVRNADNGCNKAARLM